MQTIRKEVQTFLHAAETLLSPVTLGSDLNEDERDMVSMYAQSLNERFPAKQFDRQEQPSVA